MIVCSCNVLSDRAIRDAIERDVDCAGRLSDIYARLGCRPQCGRCAPSIRKLAREAATSDPTRCPAVLDRSSGDDALLAAE